MPIFIGALAMPMILTNSHMRISGERKTCSMRDRIFDRRPLARAVASLIDRSFGFF
ncbi:MAG: hypothetical protein M9924_20335 [Rhizobiaceae bacterium]|nr:hypothetical protein [Rhizobiaceae bacterium]